MPLDFSMNLRGLLKQDTTAGASPTPKASMQPLTGVTGESFVDSQKKPIDPKRDAVSTMSFIDIIPEAVTHYTGSEVAGLLASLVSPDLASKMKKGAQVLGIVGTRSLKVGPPQGLKDKLGQISKEKGYTKKSQLLEDPDNWWKDPNTGVVYSLSDRGTIYGVPASSVAKEGRGVDQHLTWYRKSIEAQRGRQLTDDEWASIKPSVKYNTEAGFRGSYNPNTNVLEVNPNQVDVNELPQVHNVSAHEGSHFTEHVLNRAGHTQDLDHIAKYSDDGSITLLPEALGTNQRTQAETIASEMFKKNPTTNTTHMLKGFDFAEAITRNNLTKVDEIFEWLVKDNPNSKELKDLKEFYSTFASGNTAREKFVDTMKAMPKEAAKAFSKDFKYGTKELIIESRQRYLDDPGEVLARTGGYLAEVAKSSGTDDVYNTNLENLRKIIQQVGDDGIK